MALAPKYADKLHALIAAMRKEFNAAEVPFIAGQIGRFEEKPWNEHQTQVDQVHRELPKHVPFTAFVSSENLKHNGDKLHFDTASYCEFGKRYFAAFSELKKTAAK